MKSIIFQNSGEIDLRTVSTFGCSVKETTNPIGFFGTGLKYALAVLLRTSHTITIQSGDEQLEVSSQKDTLRGKEFEFVHMGQSPVGFTTELGKNWEVWMAYRELYCNAKDEVDGLIYESDDTPEPTSGMTRIIVAGSGIITAHQSRREFILEGEPAVRIGSIEVFDRPTTGFFYKGIKVMNFDRPALFTYNQTEHIILTEDRTVREPSSVLYSLARAILSHAEPAMLEKVLLADNNNIEYNFDYDGWSDEPSADFFPTVEKLQRSALTKVNNSALAFWRKKGRGFIDPRRIKATKIQLSTLEKAIEFCEKSGFMLRDEYPIILVETLGEGGTLAMADRFGKQIFLTERIFQTGGTKGVARALIEEYLHLKFKFDDCSRDLQNFLFDKMVSLAEELQGEAL